MANRGRIIEHPLDRLGGCDDQLNALMRVGLVGHADRHFHAHEVVGKRPIDDALGDEILVRNQVLGAVAGDDRGVACTEVVDPTVGAVDLNHIARFDRVVD